MSLRRSTRSRLRAAFQDRQSNADLWRALAAGEAVGSANLEVLARRHEDDGVRTLAAALAGDCQRHTTMLEAHADTISTPADARPFNFTQGREAEDRDCRGYPTAQQAESIGTISCLATLNVAVQSSVQIYRCCLAHSQETDPAGASMCEAILGTLREHARSFAQALATHQEDNPLQVREALRAARRSPFMAQWKRAGLHSGAGFSRGLLYALYYTVLVPFGVLARRSKAPARSPRAPAQGADSRSQFKSQY